MLWLIINLACPQLHNMAAQLAQSLALRLIDFTGVTSCPVLQIEAKKSDVTIFLFKGSQNVCSGRQGKHITA